MANIIQKDFSAGWCPGDDSINGRSNGLLQCDNVDLDTNGALALIGGTVVKQTLAANAHTLYSRVMNGTRHDYSALTSGAIIRDSTSIGTGGDTTNAAFATAFNFTLIASGAKLLKDNGATAVNLGILPPTAVVTAATGALLQPFKKLGNLAANTVTPVGTSAVIGGTYLEMTADGTGNCVVQTFNGASVPYNANLLTNSDLPFGIGITTGYALDSDTVNFTGYVVSPIGKVLKIDVLLVAGGAGGAPVSDFYTYKVDLGSLPYDPLGVFTIQIRRDQFERMGNGVQDWSTVYGFRLSFISTAADVINIFGSLVSTTDLRIAGGTKSYSGTYQYLQVNVNNTGSYLAKSIGGPISDPIDIVQNQVAVIPQNPGAVDAQVNEAWIFRRGGLLEQFYRVAVSTTYASFYDSMSDQDALTLNIKLNTNLISVKSIPDKIYEIVGPIQQRWYYFTVNQMYPSDFNDPDLVDSSLAIRTTGSNSELFLWARQVDRALVLVGTSTEVYTLSGTFATLPDFSIDIYYHGVGCKFPPLTYDADVFSGAVIYLANDGWRSIDAGNQNPLLVAPNSDKLYRGISSYGYIAPNLTVAPGSVRFPVCIAQNKLWCFITGTGRCEVFDLIRKYWRVVNYFSQDVTATIGTQDGQILAFYGFDKKLREINKSSSKLIDGTTKQTVNLKWVVQDGGSPRQRKDSSTFKVRFYSANDPLAVNITNDLNVTQLAGLLQSNGAGLDKFIDLSVKSDLALVKTYQVTMAATAADFLLEDWSIDYELRPPQVSFLRVLPQNFGNGSKKRVRNWPAVLDTLGGDVIWTPSVDNSLGATTTLNTPTKNTKSIFYVTDAFGVDYGGTFHSTDGLFEFFEMLQPTIVQTLPIAKRFDQVGPEEFFKYGKVKQFELRVMSFGGTVIPYTMYFSDIDKRDGSITVVDGKEDSYYIDVPKGTSGRIARITFGPTDFDFHRFYVRLQVADSGKDTELNWITIANE